MSDQVAFDHRGLAISVVSHGQGEMVRPLLEDLVPLARAGAQVLLTLNIPEDEGFLAGLGHNFEAIRNPQPLGFGANHNQAFGRVDRPWFAVVNPDVRCPASAFISLVDLLVSTNAAVIAPRVTDPRGADEDSVRRFPSASRIGMRVLRRILGQRLRPDYSLDGDVPFAVDWAAGMFLLFDAAAYRSVGGFDERYFMYLEDADICRRLWAKGRRVIAAPSVSVVHDAQRASSRSLKHMHWHGVSMARFLFFSP